MQSLHATLGNNVQPIQVLWHLMTQLQLSCHLLNIEWSKQLLVLRDTVNVLHQVCSVEPTGIRFF